MMKTFLSSVIEMHSLVWLKLKVGYSGPQCNIIIEISLDGKEEELIRNAGSNLGEGLKASSNNVGLSYTEGQACPGGGNYTTDIDFICQQVSTQLNIYNFELDLQQWQGRESRELTSTLSIIYLLESK